MERSQKYRFTLTDLLIFAAALPVLVGIVEVVHFHSWTQSWKWFGNSWHIGATRFLIDRFGVPERFALFYVSDVLRDAATWICYVLIAMFIGLLRVRWALPVGIAFLTSVLMWHLMSDYFSGRHWKMNLRLISLFEVAIATLCFAMARRIRGGTHSTLRTTTRIGFGFTLIAIAACLALSVYGWRLIDLERKAGIETQKELRDFGL